MSETVEVKVIFPRALYDLLVEVCETVKYNSNKFIIEAVRGDISAQGDSNFNDYIQDWANDVRKRADAIEIP